MYQIWYCMYIIYCVYDVIWYRMVRVVVIYRSGMFTFIFWYFILGKRSSSVHPHQLKILGLLELEDSGKKWNKASRILKKGMGMFQSYRYLPPYITMYPYLKPSLTEYFLPHPNKYKKSYRFWDRYYSTKWQKNI